MIYGTAYQLIFRQGGRQASLAHNSAYHVNFASRLSQIYSLTFVPLKGSIATPGMHWVEVLTVYIVRDQSIK